MAENVATLLVKLDADVERLRRAMRDGEKSVNKFDKTVNRRLKAVDKRFKALGRTVNNFRNIIIAGFAARAVKGIITTADNMGMLQDRIKSATRETGGFQKVWEGLVQTSLRTGAALETSVSLFQRLSFTQKELGATNKDMIRLNDIIQKLGVISGATTEQMKNGTLQLSQGLGEGIFRAQEFNSVLENMPAVLNAVARSLNLTVSEMRKLVKGGELESRKFFDAILEQGGRVDEEFTELAPRVSRAWNKVMLALGLRISEINKELLATKGLALSFEAIAAGLAPDEKAVQIEERLNKILNERLALVNEIERPRGTGLGGGITEPKGPLLAQVRALDVEYAKLIIIQEKLKDVPEELIILGEKLTLGLIERETLLERIATLQSGKIKTAAEFEIKLLDESIVRIREKIKLIESIDPDAAAEFGEPEAPVNKLLDRAEAKILGDVDWSKKQNIAFLQFQKDAAATKDILNDLEIDVLRASGNVIEAIRAETAAEIRLFEERVEKGKATAMDLAQFRILTEQRTSAEIQKIIEDDMRKANKGAIEFGNAMASAFESRGIDALLNGDLSGALKGIIKDFAEMALRLLVLKPLAQSIFGSLGKGGNGGGILGSILGFASTATAGKAGGGGISGPTLVGERGPELFIPNTTGTIKTVADTRSMMGGGKTDIVQNITMATDVKNTVHAEIAQAVPLIAQATAQLLGNQFAGVRT